jgi:hypothetical protein
LLVSSGDQKQMNKNDVPEGSALEFLYFHTFQLYTVSPIYI